MVFESLEPPLVWEIFEQVFTKTPRASKKEEKIRSKLKEWVHEQAKSKGIEISITEDDVGNLLFRKKAKKGMEGSPPILLQGHMDMVTETDKPDGFDFDNNAIPIRIQENGEWVDSDGTTLGADNGIGVSLGLALLFNPDVAHGPLELLVTVDEETGLVGAFGLDLDKLGIKSKLMINLDSEDIGIITIGSAGGGDLIFEKSLDHKGIEHMQFYELEVSGLFGGHSGVDIHKPRANANKLAARLLSVLDSEMDVTISWWNGGSKHNAITRNSSVKFGIPADQTSRAEELLTKERAAIMTYYHSDAKNAEIFEPNIVIEWKSSHKEPTFSVNESSLIVSTAHITPHGPIRFSPTVDGLVELSNNLAIIKTENSEIEIHLSARGNIDADLEQFRRSLVNLGKLGRWNVTKKDAYPGWKPEPKSEFLQFVRKHYEKVLEKDIKVEAIHAGLECGIIGAKIPGIQMVSIGPTIKNPHTPEEKLRIADVAILYDLLKNLLSDIVSLGK